MSDTPDFRLPPTGGERDGAIPRFYTEPYQDTFASEKAGQPVFREREMVSILIPGDRRSEWSGLVKAEHRARWPREYDAFKRGLEEPEEGTPLSAWPAINRAQVEELKFAHVRTVEALAALPDAQLNTSISMGGFSLREKARRWLAEAAGAAPREMLAAENEQLRANMEVMKQQMDELQKIVTRLSEAPRAEVAPASGSGGQA